VAKKYFEILAYRLNVADPEPGLFDEHFDKLAGNDDNIVSVFKYSTDPKYRYISRGEKADYAWDIREFLRYGTSGVYGLTLARSLTRKQGKVVEASGITDGESSPHPPLAETIDIFFFMNRHMVAVEHLSAITSTDTWKKIIQETFVRAAWDNKFVGKIELEPVPQDEEIIKAFNSFSRLTRLRVDLRLPNPELNRFSKYLYDQMEESGIKEYLQDMKNSSGLNKKEGAIPRASVEIAQAGYKRGTIRLEGYRGGRFEKIHVGAEAARGTINIPREEMKEIKKMPTSIHSVDVVIAIMEEVNNIAPPPDQEE